ncbi:hypothetical protein [uncultured Microbacterium sp.]|uniref:hypothetical protein n=1 Tax=uncultured Microbacterium sp. TaxID=191216 RepID=UPI002628F147|nr:hypothetical protein [uncultured Microbacterium sp.]
MSSQADQQPESDATGRANAALAALAGNVTHRPTDHEIDLSEALTALLADHEALLSDVKEQCAVAFDRGVDAELEAAMRPDPVEGYKFPSNPYRQEHP